MGFTSALTKLRYLQPYSTAVISTLNAFTQVFSLMSTGGLSPGAFEVYDDHALALMVLVLVFGLFFPIVLLNALIALMGDMFDKVQMTAPATLRFEKCLLLLDMEYALSATDRSDRLLFPRSLTLYRAKPAEERGEWEGKVVAFKQAIKNENAKLDAKLEQVLALLQAKV